MTSHGNTEGKSLRDKMEIVYFKKFGSANLEDYEKKLKSLNLVALAEHAIQFNVMANVDRHRMEKLLIGEFRKAKSRYEEAVNPTKPIPELSLEKKERILERLKFISQ